VHHHRFVDYSNVAVVLCDADGNLFPSEEPAFDASVEVTNRYLQSLGLPARYTAEELRLSTTGRNFRTTAVDLAVAWGVPLEPALADGRAGDGSPATGSTRMLTAAELETWARSATR
jgi:hypothetical protein